jgi:hypothetical protein
VAGSFLNGLRQIEELDQRDFGPHLDLKSEN